MRPPTPRDRGTADQDELFMQRALLLAEQALAEDEVPVGAIVVLDGEVIGEAYNRKERSLDPSAHAEMLAIREAAAQRRNWRLAGSVLYVTKEPCIMCCGVILHARISRVVYGCRDEKGGGAETLYRLLDDSRLNHRVELSGGVCEAESARLLRTFFRGKRV